ncbi:signal peptidase complex subunit 1 [Homalodisca vitripennis]|uniref:signal peptidase complex subunit 1 n=1 Tax=Homalodisca vitripennis TaxID=197043 RepID=UPI001EEB1244|nr:signal peptidase complex subunit 1 [Homalodisca vitripennis]KAG8268048.1 Signal peptidase complex subunit 1 [Homalodisca vitripennis]
MDILNSLPTHMDFDGQKRAEKLSRIIITLFGAVGLVWGYIIQQFSQTVYIVGAGFALAAIVTTPPWPMYRRKPLPWQKPRSDSDGEPHQKPKKKK